jgi:ribosomal protein S18 acetylase RimI-like enzyme
VPTHSLGPHVVGQRIVLRRLVPGETGPTGGPAFTDVLGICTSWGDSTVVVQPESADPVTIPLDLVVAGKPVPPRASPRLRVSVRDAELLTASLVGIETTSLGEWQLRFEPAPAGRIRNRFNSCLGVGDPELPLADAAALVGRFYAERDRSPRIQVELGSGTESGLRDLGWTPVAGRDSSFLLASLARVKRRCAVSGALGGPEPARLVVDGPRVTVDLGEVARAEARIDGDWLGIHDLSVEPAYRRRGLAHAVLGELLEWGAEQGATTVWLHVETGNEPALALYDGLGFSTHHSCRYLQAPGY